MNRWLFCTNRIVFCVQGTYLRIKQVEIRPYYQEIALYFSYHQHNDDGLFSSCKVLKLISPSFSPSSSSSSTLNSTREITSRRGEIPQNFDLLRLFFFFLCCNKSRGSTYSLGPMSPFLLVCFVEWRQCPIPVQEQVFQSKPLLILSTKDHSIYFVGAVKCVIF